MVEQTGRPGPEPAEAEAGGLPACRDTILDIARRTLAAHDRPHGGARPDCCRDSGDGWCELRHWAQITVMVAGLRPPY